MSGSMYPFNDFAIHPSEIPKPKAIDKSPFLNHLQTIVVFAKKKFSAQNL